MAFNVIFIHVQDDLGSLRVGRLVCYTLEKVLC